MFSFPTDLAYFYVSAQQADKLLASLCCLYKLTLALDSVVLPHISLHSLSPSSLVLTTAGS